MEPTSLITLLPLLWLLRMGLRRPQRPVAAQLLLRGGVLAVAPVTFVSSPVLGFALTPLWLAALWSWPFVLLVTRFARRPWHVYWATLLLWPFELRDSWRAGAAFMTARWLVGRADRAPSDLAYVRAKMGRPKAVEAIGMTAFGLVTAMDGDLATARMLFEALVVETTEGCVEARRTARQFLVLDMLRRGELEDVVLLAESDDPLCRAIAARLSGRTTRRARGRVEQWILGRPDLERIPFDTLAPSKVSEPRLPNDPLDRAVACHAGLLLADTRSARTFYFHRACETWDHVFDVLVPEGAFDARVRELGIDRSAVYALRRRIKADLADVLRAHWVELLPQRGIAAEVREEVAEEIVADVELWAQRLEARVPSTTTGNVYDWIEYRAMRRMYGDAWRIGGPETRAVLYLRVYPCLTNLVARAINDGFDFRLARAATSWMRGEAWAVGHERSFALHTRNSAAAKR